MDCVMWSQLTSIRDASERPASQRLLMFQDRRQPIEMMSPIVWWMLLSQYMTDY